MATSLITQHQTVAYIACDLADQETLADYRRRIGSPRRHWWHVGRR